MVEKFYSELCLKLVNSKENQMQSPSNSPIKGIRESIEKIENFVTVFLPASSKNTEAIKMPLNEESEEMNAEDISVPPENISVFTKGSVPVDSYVPNKEYYKVYQDGNNSYSATLNQTNLDMNNNKFYIVQILLNEKTN